MKYKNTQRKKSRIELTFKNLSIQINILYSKKLNNSFKKKKININAKIILSVRSESSNDCTIHLAPVLIFRKMRNYGRRVWR